MKEPIKYMVEPNILDVEIFVDYLINNVSFNKVLQIYKELNNKLKTKEVEK